MNEMEQLREDIRATAPEPRPEFAARLERNVEAGFKPAKAPKPARSGPDSSARPSRSACTALRRARHRARRVGRQRRATTTTAARSGGVGAEIAAERSPRRPRRRRPAGAPR